MTVNNAECLEVSQISGCKVHQPRRPGIDGKSLVLEVNYGQLRKDARSGNVAAVNQALHVRRNERVASGMLTSQCLRLETTSLTSQA